MKPGKSIIKGAAWLLVSINVIFGAVNFYCGYPIVFNALMVVGGLVSVFCSQRAKYQKYAFYILSISLILGYTGLLLLFRHSPQIMLIWGPTVAFFAYLSGPLFGTFLTIIILALTCASIFIGAYVPLPLPVIYFQQDTMIIYTLTAGVLIIVVSAIISLMFFDYVQKLHKFLLEQNDQLSSLNETIMNQYNDKTTLFRILCHDIANPLTVVRSHVEIGQSKPTNPCRHCTIAFKSIERIEAIIKNAREYEGLKSRKHALCLERIDLATLFFEVSTVHADQLTQKNLTLQVPKLSREEIFLTAEHSTLLTSVMANIVTNAIKFSQMGSTIVIDFNVTDKEIAVRVMDHGIGIPEEILTNIFASSKPTVRPGTAGETGTGFGLAIVKSYMDIYGGSIAIASRCPPDQAPGMSGTTVTLTFKRNLI